MANRSWRLFTFLLLSRQYVHSTSKQKYWSSLYLRARLTARNVAGPAALVPILTRLELDGIDVEEVQIRRPTLDEAFHTLTTGTATAASTGPELAMGGTR